jgi:hypothetical protein
MVEAELQEVLSIDLVIFKSKNKRMQLSNPTPVIN